MKSRILELKMLCVSHHHSNSILFKCTLSDSDSTHHPATADHGYRFFLLKDTTLIKKPATLFLFFQTVDGFIKTIIIITTLTDANRRGK